MPKISNTASRLRSKPLTSAVTEFKLKKLTKKNNKNESSGGLEPTTYSTYVHNLDSLVNAVCRKFLVKNKTD